MSNKDFGVEKISRLLFRFSIPVILSMLVSELYSMVDTFFVGREVGGEGIGALVVVFPLQRILMAISIMIAVGTATAFSRHSGNNNIGKARQVLQTGFSLMFSIMIPVSIGIFIFRNQIVGIMGAGAEISSLAATYLGIIIIGTTFLGMTIFISHNMIALGNPKVSIISTSIGAVINIILDFALVQGIGMGVQGAAIATATSQIAGFAYAFYHYTGMRKKYNIPLKYKLDFKLIAPILLVGVSAFVTEAEDGILMGVLSSLLTSTAGDQGIIILGVVSKLYMFLFITIFGIASAMQPIAAYNVGARNYVRLRALMRRTIVYAAITSFVMWAVTMIFTPQLIGIFIEEPLIIAEATRAFRIMVAVFPVISIYYVSIFYFQASGRAKTSIAVAVLRQLVIMLPVALILVKGFNMGAMGVWLSYPISDLLASIASFMLIRNEGIELNTAIAAQNGANNSKEVAVH
ncbi:MAG: MATE family efflux transporter [Bacillota bacterium]